MKAIVDTNVLLRMFVDDDPEQSRAAVETLEAADLIVIGLQTLCELVWVLDRSYQTSRTDIAAAIRQLLDIKNVIVNRPAVEAGLSILDAGATLPMASLLSRALGLAAKPSLHSTRRHRRFSPNRGRPLNC